MVIKDKKQGGDQDIGVVGTIQCHQQEVKMVV